MGPRCYDGEDLKRIRTSKGIELSLIAEKTRISRRYLEYIEADNYQFLPPMTYLKGYLAQYASYLELNPSEVVKNYLGYFMDWAIKGSPLFSIINGGQKRDEIESM